MLFTVFLLAAQTPAPAPRAIDFDLAMAEKQCVTHVGADDLDARIECLDYQLRGRRLWILFAAAEGARGQSG